MPFKKELTELMERVPGVLGVIIADWEGEAVDQVARMDEYDLKLHGAHGGVILNNMREIVRRLNDDELQEIVMTAETLRTLMIPVTPDYYLVVALDRSGSLGQALHAARHCAEIVRRDIL